MQVNPLKRNDISFIDDTHQYFNTISGKEYHSVSKVISMFTPSFEANAIAGRISKKTGQLVSEILASWDRERLVSIDRGNKIHSIIETYINTGIAVDGGEVFCDAVEAYLDRKEYDCILAEAIVASDSLGVAGCVDLPQISSMRKACKIGDYKTNKEINYKSKYRKKMLWPLSSMDACEFVKYSLQLNIYAYIIDKEYGLSTDPPDILHFPHDNIMKVIPIPIMPEVVGDMVDYFHDRKKIRDRA